LPERRTVDLERFAGKCPASEVNVGIWRPNTGVVKPVVARDGVTAPEDAELSAAKANGELGIEVPGGAGDKDRVAEAED
jgi:hypothetical protein